MSTEEQAKRGDAASVPEIRRGQGPGHIDRATFSTRFRERFDDPAFAAENEAIRRIEAIAWEAYEAGRKAPRTRPAGPEFADPKQELSVEWLAARSRIHAAQARHDDPQSPSRVLVIIGSPRNDDTCPSEASKTWRLAKIVEEEIGNHDHFESDVLDLSLLTSEYGRTIFPCKACVSTAMPLCHWPCSCYPNHALGQTGDMMNEIYERAILAHAIVVVTPVHWYQAPTTLKLVIDRLVCADGGNADPTTTSGKDPEKAKAIELAGWDYPQHLKGRSFGVIVHGDAGGVENLRRSLTDWLSDIGMVGAGHDGALDRYIGYYHPYATSHVELDKDIAIQEEAKNVARAVCNAIVLSRAGRRADPGEGLSRPRAK